MRAANTRNVAQSPGVDRAAAPRYSCWESLAVGTGQRLFSAGGALGAVSGPRRFISACHSTDPAIEAAERTWRRRSRGSKSGCWSSWMGAFTVQRAFDPRSIIAAGSGRSGLRRPVVGRDLVYTKPPVANCTGRPRFSSRLRRGHPVERARRVDRGQHGERGVGIGWRMGHAAGGERLAGRHVSELAARRRANSGGAS